MGDWQNRIVGYGDEDADQLLANPANWRIHPKNQQDALAAVLDNVGWVQNVIVNKRTGFVVDGHMRAALAISKGARVPVTYVDLSPEEEAVVLASFDPISAAAGVDAEKLDALLRDVQTNSPALDALLAEVAGKYKFSSSDEWGAAFGNLPNGDRAPFQQMTFTLHDEQAETVKHAIEIAKSLGTFEDSENENSNGNALARVCELFLGEHGQC